MDQRELLEAYRNKREEHKKQKQIKSDADKALKAADEYIKNVKTEVANIKKEL
jgi:hypothetical protein